MVTPLAPNPRVTEAVPLPIAIVGGYVVPKTFIKLQPTSRAVTVNDAVNVSTLSVFVHDVVPKVSVVCKTYPTSPFELGKVKLVPAAIVPLDIPKVEVFVPFAKFKLGAIIPLFVKVREFPFKDEAVTEFKLSEFVQLVIWFELPSVIKTLFADPLGGNVKTDVPVPSLILR